MTRKFSVLGDSISTFEGYTPDDWSICYTGDFIPDSGVLTVDDTWWMQVIKHLDGELLANGAWSGSVVEGTVFPQGASKERAEALAKNGEAPDDVLVFFGINDYGWGSGYAQVAAGSPNAPKELAESCPDAGAVAGVAPEGTVANFEAAYSTMLANVKSLYPNVRIWCSTLLPGRIVGAEQSTFPTSFRGVHWTKYNEAIRRAAAANDAILLDTAALGFDYEGIDGTHPTKKGMSQMAAMFIQCMRKADATIPTTPFEGESLLTEEWKSQEFCNEPCMDCKWAKGVGNHWYNVCEKRL